MSESNSSLLRTVVVSNFSLGHSDLFRDSGFEIRVYASRLLLAVACQGAFCVRPSRTATTRNVECGQPGLVKRCNYEMHMKKSILITTLAIFSLPFFSAFAQDYDGREDYRDRNESRHRGDYRRSSDYRQLRAELDQLNRMFAHVRANLRTYGTGRHLWRDYSRLLRDRDRLNYELQSRSAAHPRAN